MRNGLCNLCGKRHKSLETARRAHPASDFKKGERIQTHPATDDWMRGDRYGEVVGLTARGRFSKGVSGVKVTLDRSGRTKTFHPDNLQHLGSQFK